MAEDLLFATLDPTMRAIELPGVEKAILSDTVGFISDLPTQLVAAFRATLEEVVSADIIVHVRDIANPDHIEQKTQVLSVLGDLDVVDPETGEAEVPMVEVWNKWDLLDADQAEELTRRVSEDDGILPLSAISGDGVDGFLETLGKLLTQNAKTYEFALPGSEGRKIAWLHAHGRVLEEGDVEDGAGGEVGNLAAQQLVHVHGRDLVPECLTHEGFGFVVIDSQRRNQRFVDHANLLLCVVDESEDRSRRSSSTPDR